ncbi:MAG: precorrin-6Y C5,15-methyltransferase (decarboxylating) subunit CbiT [Paracoccus sp. (in: a-proteobacteria)]|uniref:precorrin-6Y C5,15-methyltransferase (decarboxylating) subunit CbiT n=1 Tax=Paracoccus sp. TaxID=267 RepID=UPI0026DF4E9A|nr:precorrin-6Y C5,15-methyltransferase (decarboxylating) subunit CbiT [Paracoccus sp. (in: a-proteobacteria)]MDO5620997.1 precorrin-6Y C5,15-methyltransferase (decarboxylating) subunit CbiT [Paracoccus sp. (in: a-proteobacteria)]
MSEPWLSIIGFGEDGPDGLSPASRAALDAAAVVFGGPRHLALAGVGVRGRAWPVPFSIAPVLALRGQRVAVLASGDPFWFGAGGTLAAALDRAEWRAFPAPGVFSLLAARLGWRLEGCACLGLHAAHLTRLLPHLRPGARLLVTLRDGAAVADLAAWLVAQGWGDSSLWVGESLGGGRERLRQTRAAGYDLHTEAPVAVAIQAMGGTPRPVGFGLPDDAFIHHGQITKRAIRAVTLSSLAPLPGQMLWDLGAGSGSISVEWALAGGRVVAVENRADRAALIAANIQRFGLETVDLRVQDHAALDDLPAPDAVFIGGGASAALVAVAWDRLPLGGRLVVNAVTLETQALVMTEQAARGGELLRLDIAQAEPLGRMRGWQAQRTVLHWVARK